MKHFIIAYTSLTSHAGHLLQEHFISVIFSISHSHKILEIQTRLM